MYRSRFLEPSACIAMFENPRLKILTAVGGVFLLAATLIMILIRWYQRNVFVFSGFVEGWGPTLAFYYSMSQICFFYMLE